VHYQDVEATQTEPADFTEFVRERRGDLVGYATMLTGRAWLADDLVSDVLGRAFERWDRIAGVEFRYAYVRRMVLNEYLTWRRRRRPIEPLADLHDVDQPVEGHENGYAAREEMLARLDKLPRKQRAAVVHRFFLGLSDVESAAELGCGPTTVRTHISRALRTLRLDAADASDAADTGALAPAPNSLLE
jgi:RNA polymerase sigma factor (sigma-70 family)